MTYLSPKMLPRSPSWRMVFPSSMQDRNSTIRAAKIPIIVRLPGCPITTQTVNCTSLLAQQMLSGTRLSTRAKTTLPTRYAFDASVANSEQSRKGLDRAWQRLRTTLFIKIKARLPCGKATTARRQSLCFRISAVEANHTHFLFLTQASKPALSWLRLLRAPLARLMIAEMYLCLWQMETRGFSIQPRRLAALCATKPSKRGYRTFVSVEASATEDHYTRQQASSQRKEQK